MWFTLQRPPYCICWRYTRACVFLECIWPARARHGWPLAQGWGCRHLWKLYGAIHPLWETTSLPKLWSSFLCKVRPWADVVVVVISWSYFFCFVVFFIMSLQANHSSYVALVQTCVVASTLYHFVCVCWDFTWQRLFDKYEPVLKVIISIMTATLVYKCSFCSAGLYRDADKSLARPGRKQANVSVRMAWISLVPCLAGGEKKNLMTARVSMLLKSRVSQICFRACFLPGRAKDLLAPQ